MAMKNELERMYKGMFGAILEGTIPALVLRY
jgi:hypothetical protein